MMIDLETVGQCEFIAKGIVSPLKEDLPKTILDLSRSFYLV